MLERRGGYSWLLSIRPLDYHTDFGKLFETVINFAPVTEIERERERASLKVRGKQKMQEKRRGRWRAHDYFSRVIRARILSILSKGLQLFGPALPARYQRA